MHGAVSQICCQLAHLFSKTDIPSALHHQQDLDLVLTLRMCGDSWWKGKEPQVIGNACSKTVYIKTATYTVLMKRNAVGDIWHLQLFNLYQKHEHLEAFRHKTRRIHYSSLKGLRSPYLFLLLLFYFLSQSWQIIHCTICLDISDYSFQIYIHWKEDVKEQYSSGVNSISVL